MLPTVTGEFRVVADPELRFASSGMAICSVRIVANSRKKDESGEWKDDKVVWLRATGFKRMAENMAESLVKGALVLVTGRLQTEEYEKDGEKKQSYTVLVDTIGPSLANKAARILDAPASGGGGGGSAPTSDGWTPPAGSEEPPF